MVKQCAMLFFFITVCISLVIPNTEWCVPYRSHEYCANILFSIEYYSIIIILFNAGTVCSYVVYPGIPQGENTSRVLNDIHVILITLYL